MRKGLIIGGVIIVAAIGFLLYMSFGESTIYYVSVSELYDKGEGGYDTNLRVAGVIAEDSIEWDYDRDELTFDVEGGGAFLPVVYKGSKPNGFADGAEVVVEGKYSRENVFHATIILMTCPSKYEEKV